ncbi:hypothetical protein [Buchnera aphidicola]|nr:hypothetical protein [Buchnera aphidicola]
MRIYNIIASIFLLIHINVHLKSISNGGCFDSISSVGFRRWN